MHRQGDLSAEDLAAPLAAAATAASTELSAMAPEPLSLSVTSAVPAGGATVPATGRPVVVCQYFDGGRNGAVALCFPDLPSLDLVRSVMDIPLMAELIVDTGQEVLLEVSNVVLNAVIAALAPLTGGALVGSLPMIMDNVRQPDWEGAGGYRAELGLRLGRDPAERRLILLLTFGAARAT